MESSSALCKFELFTLVCHNHCVKKLRMRATLSRTTRESAAAPDVSSAESAARAQEQKAQLVQELETIKRKIQTRKESLRAAPTVRRDAIKNQLVTYMRRQKLLERRLCKLEAQMFNADQLAAIEHQAEAIPEPEEPPEQHALESVVVEGTQDQFRLEILVAELNAIIAFLANKETANEADYAKELEELESRNSNRIVSLHGMIAEFDEGLGD
jgi:hypothetical protein